MSNEIGIERTLLADFLGAVDQRQIDHCEFLLEQVRQLSHQNPDASHWHAYLSAILTDIRDSDWAAAERQYQRILANAQIPQFLRGQVLLSLGISYSHQGRWREAEDTHKEALQIYTQAREVSEQVKTQNNLAALYWSGFSQGDFDARALYKADVLCNSSLKSLANLAKTTEVLSLYAMVWNTLGITCMSLGRWERAIYSYEQMLGCYNQLNNQFGMGIAYANLGETYHRRGASFFELAFTQYDKALAIFQDGNHLNESLDILANLAALYADREQFARALEYYTAAIELSERVRSGQTSEKARAGYFSTISEIFANAVLACRQLGLTAQAFNYAEQARSRAFLDLLEAGLPDLERDIGASTLTLGQVQRMLPENALLLEYFTTGLVEARQQTAGEPIRHRFPPAQTLVFAVTRTEAHLVDAGISPNDLYPRDRDATVSNDLLTSHVRRALYSKLLEPFSALLQQKQVVYLIPHGPLHYVPFQALLGPEDVTLLAEDGPQLVYAPSASVLLRNSASGLGPERHPQTGQPALMCLTVGYNGGAVDLRFAEDEALGVALLMGGDGLVGSAATKVNVLERAPHCQILHMSCHGTFDPAAPLDSALHLANGETLTAGEVLAHLRLPHCRLVTLSACESGLSMIQRGDELFGLVRAFIFAGATALVVTQWRVDERSTHILMEKFYKNMRDGMPIAQALKEAQLYLRSLSRAQAEEILRRLTAESENWQTDHRHFAGAPANDVAKRAESSRSDWTDPSSLHPTNPTSSAADAPHERVFDDPYHWAPFVLIGGHYGVESRLLL